MRYLGIDYGSKRVGLALSDERNLVAFPHSVLKNADALIGEIGEICIANAVTHIILGESKDFKGEDNGIMKSANAFKERVGRELNIPVSFESEFLTSAQADRQSRPNKPDLRRHAEAPLGKAESKLDASAAALILQSYLDKKNKTTAFN